jgi:hypothetical protein
MRPEDLLLVGHTDESSRTGEFLNSCFCYHQIFLLSILQYYFMAPSSLFYEQGDCRRGWHVEWTRTKPRRRSTPCCQRDGRRPLD